MNTPELKPGDWLRVCESQYSTCKGCVLAFTAESFRNERGTWGLTPAHHSDCDCDNDDCCVLVSDTYEILTPEEVMEIELSR